MFNKTKAALVAVDTPALAGKIALRDFRDAGAELIFARGDVVDADAGTLANYAAAGLIGDAPDAGAATPA